MMRLVMSKNAHNMLYADTLFWTVPHQHALQHAPPTSALYNPKQQSPKTVLYSNTQQAPKKSKDPHQALYSNTQKPPNRDKTAGPRLPKQQSKEQRNDTCR